LGVASVVPMETLSVTLSNPVGVTIADGSATGTITNDDGATGGQPVIWTALVGVTANANSLTKTATTAWGNAGAISTQTIPSGNGYVEFTASG
jgi:chitinase